MLTMSVTGVKERWAFRHVIFPHRTAISTTTALEASTGPTGQIRRLKGVTGYCALLSVPPGCTIMG